MLTGENAGEMRLYEDLGDYTTIKPIFEEILKLYNAKRKAMTLVFFEDALEHLTRISRTMRLPQVWREGGLRCGGDLGASTSAGPCACRRCGGRGGLGVGGTWVHQHQQNHAPAAGVCVEEGR